MVVLFEFPWGGGGGYGAAGIRKNGLFEGGCKKERKKERKKYQMGDYYYYCTRWVFKNLIVRLVFQGLGGIYKTYSSSLLHNTTALQRIPHEKVLPNSCKLEENPNKKTKENEKL